MELLVFGTIWFWIFFLVMSSFIIWAIELDYPGRATGVFIAFAILFFFLGGREAIKDLLSFMTSNPPGAIGFIVGYFVAGTVWSIAKWYFFLLNIRDRALENREHFTSVQSRMITIPKVKEHKSRIVGWMVYWPFSAVWTILNDPVRRIFLHIYRKIEKVMQKMANNVFKDINNPNKV